MAENKNIQQNEKDIDSGEHMHNEKELVGRPKSNLGSEEEQATEVAAGGAADKETGNDAIKQNKGGLGDGPVTQNGS